jgi:hypothetical protein
MAEILQQTAQNQGYKIATKIERLASTAESSKQSETG